MRKSWPRFFGVALSLAVLGLSLISPTPVWLKRLDYLIYDLRFNAGLELKAPPELPTPIIIVDIDEASLAQEGHWPWSRQRLAKLVENLAQAGAVVIGFDVVFSEAERNPLTQLQQLLPEAKKLPEQWRDQVDADRYFAQSLSGTEAVLGFFFLDDAKIQTGQLPKPVYELPNNNRSYVLIQKAGFAANIPSLQQAAAGGFVTTFTDIDGVVRRTPLIIQHQNKLYPSLDLAMAMNYLLVDNIAISSAAVGHIEALRSVTLGDLPVRTDARGQVTVPYRGEAHSFPYYSAKDILNGQFPVDAFTGALVLVGTSTIGLADLRTTPVSTQYPGVEVHANVLAGLLTGNFPYQPEWQAGAQVFQILVVGALLAWLLPVLAPISAMLFGLMILLAVVGGNFYAWQALGMDLPLASAILLVFLLSVFNLAYGFLIENKNRKKIRGMFDQYVPPAHIERMLAKNNERHFAGESKELTVLFSDVRSFTSISEKLSASELKQLLNAYFTPITKSIFDHDGTIDKYVGDMVMAFWGAPLEDKNHAHKAVACALAMQKILARLRTEFTAQGWPEIHAGIGINTGTMNVGDMGSIYRRAYTVLGDAVNLGSRLESITKYYGVPILVSESTKNSAPDFVYRFVDCIQVKGKEEPVKVYEPLGLPDEIDARVYTQLSLLNDAQNFYKNKNWEKAKAIFIQLQKMSFCPLYGLYLERIAQLEKTALPENWNGVFKHEQK